MDFQNKQVQKAFEDQISKLAVDLHKFPWENPLAYCHWLAQSHYLVCHTSTFLCLVAAKVGPEPSRRHRDVLKHLREETGHEELPLTDMKALGHNLSEFPELLETATIYQSQYYWLERGGAVAHVGYSLMLEGLAVREGNRLLENIQRLHGKKAASFVHVHAHDDVGHFAEGLKRLNGASPDEIHQALSNLSQSCERYRILLNAIRRESAQPVMMLRQAA